MNNPKLLLLGISILIFTATSKAYNPNNLLSTLKSEISEQRQRVLNADQSTSVCVRNCERNYDDAKAYKCSVSNPGFKHEAGLPVQVSRLIFQCAISSFYLIPFFDTPSNADHFAAEETRSLL
jgi:hypothetical protein